MHTGRAWPEAGSGEKGAIPGRGEHTYKVLEAGKSKKLRAGEQYEGERWEMKLER